MDKDNLDSERIDACSFMVMTKEGPVSMCKHNANRDNYIFQTIQSADEEKKFYPIPSLKETEVITL